MDIDNKHTREKLQIYRIYLESYLSVLCNTKCKSISVYEPFAGEGLYENNEIGSALIAIDIIRKFIKKKKIRLFLNELDKKKFRKLKESISDCEFVDAYNMLAENFLSKIISNNRKDIYNLFFIDPCGYTQYSHENLDKLLDLENTDYLIFMPTTHIYRFMKEKDNPAARFVLDIGIEESTIKNINNIDSFAEELADKLKEKAATPFVYYCKLCNNRAHNSLFHLFFVTKHITGAEKFLEVKDKVKNNAKIQLTIFDEEKSQIENDLKKNLSEKISNKNLYIEIIKKGYLPKYINPILKEWENIGKLEVNADNNRRKGAFYLKENPKKTIFIRYQ